MKPRYWHYWIGLLLSVALVPWLRALHLPARFDWRTLATAYWLVLAAQSIFVAALLSLIGLPREAVLSPFLDRYRRAPLRAIFLLLFFGILAWALSWGKAFILTVDTVAVLEFRERNRREPGRVVGTVLLPAFYLFAGFLLVFAYNDVIASVRFSFAHDAAFDAMDRWLLHGLSVCDLSQWAVRTFPSSFDFLESTYFGMFPQIGAAILLLGLWDGKGRALQFVGTILISYYLALLLFYWWPAQGPYYLCPRDASQIPGAVQSLSIQNLLIAHALGLWNHVPIHRISTDYFIAFPCMHIAQPIVVMWFLRRWKRILFVLFAYDCLLVVAILLLRWHYVVDLIGGLLVAWVAIMLTDSSIFGSIRPDAAVGDR